MSAVNYGVQIFDPNVQSAGVGGLNTISTGNAGDVLISNSTTSAPAFTSAFTTQKYFGTAALTDAATISWNVNTQQVASVLLTAGVGATRILGAPTNLVDGGTYILRIKQSSGGSNALTYNAVFKWPSGSPPTLSTAANAIDILTFISDGTNLYGVAQFGFA